ncbi:hypothetical protein OV079_31330 [Nannocystis pusilla]|uniref:Uncharacterized protein n=1 Tax=Nannocystis pusilla TaxID=889268 RepID=A0A9X3ETH5_9BACT|nr:hypothetical protein [Nannocystis pusilla]MCY1009977.1 hypothetical protein [Nannocystis pusilla]
MHPGLRRGLLHDVERVRGVDLDRLAVDRDQGDLERLPVDVAGRGRLGAADPRGRRVLAGVLAAVLVAVGQALGRAVRAFGLGLDVDEVEVAVLLDIVDAGAQGRRRHGAGAPEHHLQGIAIEQGLHDRHLHGLSAASTSPRRCHHSRVGSSLARHTGA